MQAFYSHQFVLPLPPGHRFPMAKYRLLHERVSSQLPNIRLAVPEPVSIADLERAHCRNYVARALSGQLDPLTLRRIGFPWSAQMIERSRRSSGGTCAALNAALEDGIAANLAGGTHHAAWDQGGGYCVFNDSVIAARRAQAEGRLRRLLVVDLDVHQGNGTALICRDDPSIFTFSMHGERNYPALKPPGDLDVGLPDGLGDGDYLALLERHLDRAIDDSLPDAVIYLAGADPYVGDRLGRLALSKAGLAARDALVLARCREAGLPLAITMAGGYADRVEDIVDIHCQTLSLAAGA